MKLLQQSFTCCELATDTRNVVSQQQVQKIFNTQQCTCIQAPLRKLQNKSKTLTTQAQHLKQMEHITNLRLIHLSMETGQQVYFPG